MSNNRNRIVISFIGALATLLIGLGVIYTYHLSDETERMQEIIKKNQSIDSLDCAKSNEYKTVVERYITKDCGITIDGKKFSLDDFLGLYRTSEIALIKSMESQIELERENGRLKDSLNILNHQVKLINKNLGINLKSDRKGDCSVIVGYESKRIDSALVLLKHFRDRLRFDSSDMSWVITK